MPVIPFVRGGDRGYAVQAVSSGPFMVCMGLPRAPLPTGPRLGYSRALTDTHLAGAPR